MNKENDIGIDIDIDKERLAQLEAELEAEKQLRHELEKRYLTADRLVQELMDSQEEERRRICYDIHDGVAQTLVPVLHYLQILESLPATRQKEAAPLILKARLYLQQALAEVRAVIEDLRINELGHLSLSDALRMELTHGQEEHHWQVTFVSDEPELPKEKQEVLFRLVKEGLNNIRKYANTKQVSLSLRNYDETKFEVVLQDWGIGFDLEKLPQTGKRGGIGLIAMQKRAQQLGSTLEITSTLGVGTTLRMVINLADREEE
ncbi:MAG: histidine kinase [Chloroflexota bacterium]